ncbi:Uncharacterized conserved protein [Legionella quateirensis]|uniref:Uncharacterized conserved protein n=1 Tax=Legionella quateirensis TaxID=45072 RepID=A0A378P9V1_9GAMM|nr:hypothetical protein Lqua_0366 [Legionella quateirensis]STY83022.1 Uncharacterized conserved protein [Legionella quateirensis]
MELYLRWLAKYELEPGENPPLGIILCTGKTHEQIEPLELEKKLHQSIEFARQRFLNKANEK